MVPFPHYGDFTAFTPVVPELYWNVYSAEERVKALCMEWVKLTAFTDGMVDTINDQYDIIKQMQTDLPELVNEDVLAEIQRLIDSGEFKSYIDDAITDVYNTLVAPRQTAFETSVVNEQDAFEADIRQQISTFENDVTNDVNGFDARLAVIKARVDEITNLPDGSTAGDAELADIRVSYNAMNYATAGNAVRAQASNLNNVEVGLINQAGKYVDKYTRILPLEVGRAGIGQYPFTYSANNTLMRLKQGVEIWVNAHDVLTITPPEGYPDAKFACGIQYDEGDFEYFNWRQRHTFFKPGIVSFQLRKQDTATTFTEAEWALFENCMTIESHMSVLEETRRSAGLHDISNDVGRFGTLVYDSRSIDWEWGYGSYADGVLGKNASLRRVMNPIDKPIYLRKGDFATVKDFDSFSMYIYNIDKPVTSTNIVTAPYRIPEDGHYNITVRFVTEPNDYTTVDYFDILAEQCVIYLHSYVDERANRLMSPRKCHTIGHASGGTSNQVISGGAMVPENSIQGMIAYAKAGYWGVECDPRLTKDGHFVLMHDATVDRTTNGTGNVIDMTLAEVQALYLKCKDGQGGSTLTDIHPPSLVEWLEAACMYGMVVDLEFKWTSEHNDLYLSGLKEVLSKLRELDMMDSTFIMTNSNPMLTLWRSIDMEIPVYRWISAEISIDEPATIEWAKYGNCGLVLNQDSTSVFTQTLVNQYRNANFRLGLFTSYPTTRANTIEMMPRVKPDFVLAELVPDVLSLLD